MKQDMFSFLFGVLMFAPRGKNQPAMSSRGSRQHTCCCVHLRSWCVRPEGIISNLHVAALPLCLLAAWRGLRCARGQITSFFVVMAAYKKSRVLVSCLVFGRVLRSAYRREQAGSNPPLSPPAPLLRRGTHKPCGLALALSSFNNSKKGVVRLFFP